MYIFILLPFNLINLKLILQTHTYAEMNFLMKPNIEKMCRKSFGKESPDEFLDGTHHCIFPYKA